MGIEGIGTNVNSAIGSDIQLKSDNKSKKSNDTEFSEILTNAINDVNEIQKESEGLSEALAMGKVDNLHDVVIASEKADLALNLTMEVRNQLVEAHKEIMRMQI
ncbi:flagellar hook-basal body complex protein FliE [Natranaerobius trueperi]|uniref:Flagellar hook-basal body complex protein FliE n=1 Tax=Natranaerobius trueperi TaxID=759412 RepID=A0A226C0U7_9FIRM|nr:flagellar hook-basal body complex protein FliE [Natranaerobius trueperi]OWZ84224.1 flagellar hook-basal body complex protein FliE [Natranaerobius trueperi]